ncbi:protein kinase domain-containing protein [Marinobacter xestospongiae]|uniref:Protein kinase n=1 Tax=Marinobacter xestospongiae TaxID=994319 RepID=A0ABU3VXD1_9GAMM|nr:protein kinase [Marinobacter xestospongiae]MDV2078937.1 protein kinase [Marinobacter xestospongiae]
MTTAAKHKWLGEVLNDRYRIEALIASGGMSDVYRAVDTHLERAGATDCNVALKILKPETAKETASLGLLARETAKTRRLSHPNIVRVQDLEQDGETWFMVMELLEGESLSRVIQRSRPNGLKWAGARAILEQIMSALRYSHQHDVIHADLKPSNIFFTKNGQVKLLDFGVSRALTDPLHEDFLNPAHDETSIYGYTPAYALPELAEGGEPSTRGDLYALACILYELLSSRHPFDRKPLTLEERRGTKLSRPGNMPIKLWLTVKRQLLGDEKALSLKQLDKALAPIPWTTIGQTTATAAAITAAIVSWQLNSAESVEAANQIRQLESATEQLDEVRELPPRQLLAAITDLPDIERAGLLKLRQPDLMRHYLDRMDRALEPSETTGLPDTPKALEIAGEAAKLFPRDQQLLQVQDRIERRQATLQQAIAEELLSSLNQGDFKTTEDAQNLEQLASNLEFLGGTLPRPSEEASKSFNRQTATALESNDAETQSHLLATGNRFFQDVPEVQDNLAKLAALEDAVYALNRYRERVEAGEEGLPFPADAARIFYAQRFEQWGKTIKAARSSRDLDTVYDDVQSLKPKLPEGFDIIAETEKTLADAYLSRADALLARNRTRQAQPLLKRATELMR